MTNYTSLSAEGLSATGLAAGAHESSRWFDAEACAGVRYKIARISLGRRIELARRIREIGRKAEFLEAGDDVRDKLEAAVLQGEIDRVFLEWGLEAIEGLEIDAEAATPAALIERGPLALAMEILGRIRGECGLSETERKN
jgi:hypothetical protein